MDDDQLKAWQAEAMAMPERDMAKADQQIDQLRAERALFFRTLVLARLNSKMTQKDIAEQLGWLQPVISRAEDGHHNPTLNTLLAIIKAIGANLVVEYGE